MLTKVRTLLIAATAVLAFVPGAAAGQAAVEVDLTESPPSVTPRPASVAAGEVVFEASNVGAIQHELVVIRTDLAADALPVSGDNVDLSGLDVVADTDPFPAGESRTADVNLTAGDYVLICNVPGHYGLGMREALTATAGAGAPQPAPASTGNGGLDVGDAASPFMVGALTVLALAVLGGGRALKVRRSSRD